MAWKCRYPVGYKSGKFVRCGKKGTEPFAGRYYCWAHWRTLERLCRQSGHRRSVRRGK